MTDLIELGIEIAENLQIVHVSQISALNWSASLLQILMKANKYSSLKTLLRFKSLLRVLLNFEGKLSRDSSRRC